MDIDRLKTQLSSLDPRLYQIATLSTLLLYGMLWLHFDLSLLQISLIVGTALLTQYAGTRLYQLPSFDPRSPLISALSLCLLLRTNDSTVAALAAFIAVGSKFVIRWKDKHLFNPTNLALVVMLTSGLGWITFRKIWCSRKRPIVPTFRSGISFAMLGSARTTVRMPPPTADNCASVMNGKPGHWPR